MQFCHCIFSSLDDISEVIQATKKSQVCADLSHCYLNAVEFTFNPQSPFLNLSHHGPVFL